MTKEKNTAPIPPNKEGRIGLWVSLGGAAVVAIGVLTLAFYMDYQEAQTTIKENETTIQAVSNATPSSIPTSETDAASIAAATSDEQSQGMTAPSDVETSESSIITPVPDPQPSAASSSASNVATASQTQPNTSPAQAILAEENAANAETTVTNENGKVQFQFAKGKSDLAANTLIALQDVVEGVKAGKKAVIISYADAESNATLTKERAFAVRSVLLAAGVPESNIELKDPESGDHDSRRVEVVLQ